LESILDNLTLVYGIAKIFPHGSKAFKQLQLQDVIKISNSKPNVEQILSVYVNVEITNTHIISTATGQSCEGQILKEKKLVVEGEILQKLEYITDLEEQSIHAAHFVMPFSSFIVLGKEDDCYSGFDVTGYIEDIYVKKIDKRRVFKNVILLLNAVPVSKI